MYFIQLTDYEIKMEYESLPELLATSIFIKQCPYFIKSVTFLTIDIYTHFDQNIMINFQLINIIIIIIIQTHPHFSLLILNFKSLMKGFAWCFLALEDYDHRPPNHK